MRRRPAIGLIWLSLVALLLAMVPASVSAKPPIQFQDVTTGLDCYTETDDGLLLLSVFTSSEFGDFVDLAFWASPATPEGDAPSYVLTDAVVSGDATHLGAVIQVAEFDPETDPPFGDPLEPVIVDVDLEALGEPIVFDESFRDGNRTIRESGSFQSLQPSGSVTLPGADLTDLTGCSASTSDVTFWGTDPAGLNFRFEEFSVNCSWETETGFIDLFMAGDEFGGFGDVFIVDDEREIGGGNEATLTPTSVSLPESGLVDFSDGSDVGTVSASATLTETGETIRIVDRFGHDRTKIVATVFSVDGALELTLDGTASTYPMDDTSCRAHDADIHSHEVRPAGPKPKPYANETPDTAAPLALGRTARLVTGLGALEAEAPCVLDGGDEVPIGHTAWWSVVGTGSEMTADSADSAIDTVIGVYVQDGDGLVQVACVDDVFDEEGGGSLQSRVSWDSVAGETYLIQLGGFGGQSGSVRLIVE